MIDPQQFLAHLQARGVEFFTGVPDSLLKDFCACLQQTVPVERHVIAANEGGAVALAMGAHFATGGTAAVYLQNSGLGNIVNPLLSLADADVYAVPMLLIIGWRGEPGVHDEPQHKKQGRVMIPMLQAMDIPYAVLSPDMDDADAIVDRMVAQAKQAGAPAAFVVKKDTFKPYKAPQAGQAECSLTREAAIAQVLGLLDDRDVVVSTTGMPSREVYEYRAAKQAGHQRDFLTVGGMGHASQIALGLALHKPQRRVYCLDGDGALLMHMGALAITGSMKPRNFIHIVLNNGAHDSVGGQPTVGLSIDVLSLARAAGYRLALRAGNTEEVQAGLQELQQAAAGPGLLEIRVRRGARKDLGRPTSTPVQNKQAFMQFLK